MGLLIYMNKLFKQRAFMILLVCSISSTYSMQQLTAKLYDNKAVKIATNVVGSTAKSVISVSCKLYQGLKGRLVYINQVPGIVQHMSQQVAHETRKTCSNIGILAYATPGYIAQVARKTVIVSKNILKDSQQLLLKHPKISSCVGSSLISIYCLRLLLARGYSVQQVFHNAKLRFAYRLMHLCNACATTRALALGADVNHTFEGGKTVLHMAAVQGQPAVISVLLANGAAISPDDDKGYKPIHYAALSGKIAAMEILVNSGENINVLTQDAKKYSPLHIAAAAGHKDMVCWLIQHGADEQLRTAGNKSSLDLAQDAGHQNLIKYLIHISPQIDKYWFTQLLDRAIYEGNSQLVSIAINDSAFLSHVDERLTPLSRVIQKYNPDKPTNADEIAAILVQAGVPLHRVDVEGNTPLHRAAIEGNIRLVKLFLDNGADVRACNKTGQNVSTIAQNAKNQQLIKFLQDRGVFFPQGRKPYNNDYDANRSVFNNRTASL
jgi:ankyrin repeat protein